MIEENEMIRFLDKETIEVNLPNIMGYERVAMECSASFAKIIGFTQERIEDLKTAVSEACINAMEHGNKNNPDTRVVVNINFSDHEFVVNVTDEGDGFEKQSGIFTKDGIEKKINALDSPRGLGLFLIQQLSDQFEFRKLTNKGHKVKMVFKLKERVCQ